MVLQVPRCLRDANEDTKIFLFTFRIECCCVFSLSTFLEPLAYQTNLDYCKFWGKLNSFWLGIVLIVDVGKTSALIMEATSWVTEHLSFASAREVLISCYFRNLICNLFVPFIWVLIVFIRGVVNGKIRDSPRRRDRDSVRRKLSPRLHFGKIRSEQVSKTVRSETWATRYSKINKYKIDKSRVPKCYATTNLAPTYSKERYRKLLIK